jgi:hypothetical protein
MNTTTTPIEIPRLVPHPRETYLRQNETAIRSDAGRLAKDDPTIKRHLSAIEMAEDLHDYHQVCIEHFQKSGTTHRIAPHQTYKTQSFQLQLHHLDQLANLIL